MVTLMQYINHITLNTGKTRMSKDFDSQWIFAIHRIYKDSLGKDGTIIRDGYTVKSNLNPLHGLLTTIYCKDGMPLATIAIMSNTSSTLWRTLHETSGVKLMTDIDNPPTAPYIAERLEIGIVVDLDALLWIGDFIKYLAWAHFAYAPVEVLRFR